MNTFTSKLHIKDLKEKVHYQFDLMVTARLDDFEATTLHKDFLSNNQTIYSAVAEELKEPAFQKLIQKMADFEKGLRKHLGVRE